MLRLFFSVLVFSFFLLSSCAVSDQFSSKWEKTHALHSDVYINTPASYVKAEEEVSLRVFNNDEYLDIVFETNSAKTLRKIYNLGLSIWIDSEAKFKNTFAVHYPMPGNTLYSEKQFDDYLSRFSETELTEELTDRFQDYEVLDTRLNESISFSTLLRDKDYQVKLSSSPHVLFSYHMRIAIDKIFPEQSSKNSVISIGVTNVNEANEQYLSAMSSKEYIRKRLDKLKAGTDQNPEEITEWWVDFKLASKSN